MSIEYFSYFNNGHKVMYADSYRGIGGGNKFYVYRSETSIHQVK